MMTVERKDTGGLDESISNSGEADKADRRKRKRRITGQLFRQMCEAVNAQVVQLGRESYVRCRSTIERSGDDFRHDRPETAFPKKNPLFSRLSPVPPNYESCVIFECAFSLDAFRNALLPSFRRG